MEEKNISKIAILHPHITVKGGAVKLLLQIGNYLKNKVDFFTFNLDKKNCFPELNKSLNIINLNYTGIKKIFGIIKLSFILRKYNVILAGNTPMHFAAGIAKMFNKKIKVIWFCQNIPVYYIIQNKSIFTNFKKFLEKYYIIPFIDVIISNSKFIQNEVKKYYSRKSELIYPSIDLDFFKNTKVIKEERSLFINSRLVKGKNIELAIKTFEILKKKYPKLKLYIAGDGEEKKYLQSLSKNISGVVFLGEISQNEVKKYYQKCSIFLFTSLIDAFGITILEALAMKKPVISLNIGGGKEIITHNKNGFLAKNEEEFILLTEKLLNNTKKRKEFGENGRKTVEENYSQKIMFEKIENIIMY